MEGLIDFLQKYSDVDVEFIRKFLEIRRGDGQHAPFSIDLDTVSVWLKSRKETLKGTIIKTYTKNVDYILLQVKVGQNKHGGNNKETILLTQDAFKMLCMKSKTEDAQKIRYYYVTLEKLVEIYKDDIIKNQNSKIEALERNLKKVKYPVKGTIYVLQLTPDDNEGFKIGKTKDMNKRLQVYNTSMKDSPNVVYTFYSHDINRLEKCIKTALQYYEYKKDKEYYKVTKDVIIDAISDCQHLITKYTCVNCDEEMAEVKHLSRHNDKYHEIDNTMIITTLVEYENDEFEQFGGNPLRKANYIDYSVVYKLNKAMYKELNTINQNTSNNIHN